MSADPRFDANGMLDLSGFPDTDDPTATDIARQALHALEAPDAQLDAAWEAGLTAFRNRATRSEDPGRHPAGSTTLDMTLFSEEDLSEHDLQTIRDALRSTPATILSDEVWRRGLNEIRQTAGLSSTAEGSEANLPGSAAPASVHAEPTPLRPADVALSPPRDRRRLMLGAAAALLVGVLMINRMTTSDRVSVATDPTTSTQPRVPAAADRMSEVTAGRYTVGLDPQGTESAKARTVQLDAFFLDNFEVTNGEYDAFVQQIGAMPAASWPQGRLPDGLVDHPVRGIEWTWANAYCVALDKRLPSEAEWEAAARGPGASLYPWGDARETVDIDTAGTRPVGSTDGNVSVFGIHDTVASVWEWVGEPYEPVEAGQQVRRGGQNGRVRDGAAMRQVVDPSNRSVIAETGFRCAADEVDESVAPGVFREDIELPAIAVTDPPPAITGSGPGTVLVDDNFEERTSGFGEVDNDKYSFGYYAPSWYHLEVKVATAQVVAMGGYSYSDASVETHIHVDGTRSGNGRIRYGLVARAAGDPRQPATEAGPIRPSNFVAFTIDPRAGLWEVLQDGSEPLKVLQSGPLPAGVTAFNQATPDALTLEMRGTTLSGSVNGIEVVTLEVPAIMAKGDFGFYAETIDETYADVHFADLKVVAL